jgi:hypothetical protein
MSLIVPDMSVETRVTKKDTNKIIKDRVSEVVDNYNDLIELALQVGRLGKNQSIQLPDGSLLGKKEFKKMVNHINSQTLTLNRTLSETIKASKVKRSGGVGFKCPIFIAKGLQSFFERGNFGKVDPLDPKSGDLVSQLPLLTKGFLSSGQKVGYVSNRAILTPIFIIYTYVNNLQNPDNGQYIRGDSLMKTLFRTTFETISSDPRKNQNGDNFRYSSLQTIVRDNSVKLNDAQKEAIKKSVEIQNQLQREQDLVSSVLDRYREMRRPLVEERKKRKLTAQRNKSKGL